MVTLLALVATLVLAISMFLQRERSPGELDRGALVAKSLAALGLLGASGVVVSKLATPSDTVSVAVALFAGWIVSVGSYWIGENRAGHLAVASLLGSLIHLLGPTANAHISVIAGAGITALVLKSEAAAWTTIALATVVSVDFLGGRAVESTLTPFAGSIASLIGAASLLLTKSILPKSATMRVIATAALLAAGSWILGQKIGQGVGVFYCASAGLACGIAVHFLVGDDNETRPHPDSLQTGIAALIWIALATFAFGVLKGFGMSLALLGALSVLMASNCRIGLLTVGPLLGLVLYRIFREIHPETSRALDIGQHYALLGLALGMVLPLLPLENSRRGWLVSLLWGVLAVGVPALAIYLLGAIGTVGLVAGLGFSALLQALRGKDGVLPLALSAALSAVVIPLFGWLGRTSELTREDKVAIFGWGVGALVLVSLALVGAVRLESKNSKSEAAV